MNISRRLPVCSFLATAFLATLFAGTGLAHYAPKKVTKNEGLNAVTSKVSPDYPPIARQLKIVGDVELEVLVAETGTVEKVNIVSGNPVLTRPPRRSRSANSPRSPPMVKPSRLWCRSA